jgi:hypothetical protein
MSPLGQLMVMIQDGGDVIISVIQDPDDRISAFPSVEFCAPGAGGGQSTHTRKALVDLYNAIKKDNEETPQHRGM